MDPDCAICQAPASQACECEAQGLEVAIKQAEERMMRNIYTEIRHWVRSHAQDYILEYFRLLTERRKTAHTAHLERIKAHAYHYYSAPPHPTQINEAHEALKRGIDEDWRASVQRYPEVLEYFYGLVELTLPAEDEASVKDPPLSDLNGHRKGNRRNTISNGPAIAGSAAVIPPDGFHTMTPDPFISRRTPAPRDPRGRGSGHFGGIPPPPHAQPGFYPGPY